MFLEYEFLFLLVHNEYYSYRIYFVYKISYHNKIDICINISILYTKHTYFVFCDTIL